ncbi:MAG: hypothetical protein U5K31_10180 [Balneolaceae bacterium]|nr:hypothetical protein [Balneolaceae bacterium]
MLRSTNIRKVRGAAVGLLRRLLLAAHLSELSIWRHDGGEREGSGRDAFYRFLSNPCYNWRRLLLGVSSRLSGQLDPLTSRDERNGC